MTSCPFKAWILNMSEFPFVFVLCYPIQLDLYVKKEYIYIYNTYVFMSCFAICISFSHSVSFISGGVFLWHVLHRKFFTTCQSAKKHEGNKECFQMSCRKSDLVPSANDDLNISCTVCSLFWLAKTSNAGTFKPCSKEDTCYQLNPTETISSKNSTGETWTSWNPGQYIPKFESEDTSLGAERPAKGAAALKKEYVKRRQEIAGMGVSLDHTRLFDPGIQGLKIWSQIRQPNAEEVNAYSLWKVQLTMLHVFAQQNLLYSNSLQTQKVARGIFTNFFKERRGFRSTLEQPLQL